jgi:hypothetical protein
MITDEPPRGERDTSIARSATAKDAAAAITMLADDAKMAAKATAADLRNREDAKVATAKVAAVKVAKVATANTTRQCSAPGCELNRGNAYAHLCTAHQYAWAHKGFRLVNATTADAVRAFATYEAFLANPKAAKVAKVAKVAKATTKRAATQAAAKVAFMAKVAQVKAARKSTPPAPAKVALARVAKIDVTPMIVQVADAE